MTPMMVAVLAMLAASVAGQVAGASQGSMWLSGFAAAAFAAAIIRYGWQTNAPWWTGDNGISGPAVAAAQPTMLARNAGLLALGYGWGGASLLAVYLPGTVRWQHGWQYGTGMLAIAGLVFWLGRRLAADWQPNRTRVLIMTSMLHGLAATGGLFWLVYTAKLISPKGDWPANVVFAAGAVIIAGLSAMAVRTTRLIDVQARATDPASPLA